MIRDLTRGNPFKTLLVFYLPIFAANILQRVYGMVDSFIVGRTVSSDALTGVGSTGSITFLVMGIAIGLCSGFGVKIGQYKGAGDENMLRRSIAVSLMLTAAIAVVLTAITVPLTKIILARMQTPEQYFEYAYCYLLVIFSGTPATMLYNMSSGMLRAVGNSKVPLIAVAISSACNIILDLVFIVVLRWSYYGAAFATVICSFGSGAALLVYAFKANPQLIPKKEHFRLDFKLMWEHIAIGLPMSLQYVITALGVVVQQSALNGLNATTPGVATACTVAANVNNLFEIAFASMGVAAATYAAQNYGAKKYGKIRDGVTAAMVYSLCFWVFSVVCLSLWGGAMSSLFIDKNTGDALLYYDVMIKYASQFVVVQSACYPFVAIIYVYRNVIQGMGKSALTVWGGVLELIGRCISSILLVYLWGFWGVCFSHPLAWVFAAIFFLIAYAVTIKQYDTSDRRFSIKKIFAKK